MFYVTGSNVYNYKAAKAGDLNMGNTIRGLLFGKINCDVVASYLSKVNLKDNSLTDFTNHQVNKENRKSYILRKNPPFMMTEGNELILFNTQSMSGGERLWLLKLGLE